MKKFAILMIMAVIAVAVNAQNVDGGANDLMKKVSLQYQKYNTLQFHYTLKITKDDKTQGVSQGDFYLKGNKYKTTVTGQQIFCDGTSIWSYDKSANEVSVYEYDPDDDQNLMNPQRILKGWSNHFRAKFIRDEFQNNVQYSIVDLTPKTAQSYYRIRVYIGKTSLKIAKVMVYEKDNTIYTYSIEQFKSDIPLDDKMFVFDKSKYPGVEVNDMR
jgi:outer membrane lipoprotein-sorting protein